VSKVLLSGPSGMRQHVKFGKIAVIAALVALAVFAARASVGGASTATPTLSLMAVPKPAVSLGQNVLGVLKFTYPATSSPTTINHVFVRVTLTPALSADSDFNATLSGPNCALEGTTHDTVRCDLGTVRVGETRKISVVVTPAVGSIQMAGSASWNEIGNGGNPVVNNTILSTPLSDTTGVVTGSGVMGTCQTTVSTGSPLVLNTTSGTTGQRTLLTISKQAENFPCTPASAGVETATPPSGACGGAACTTQTSFVFFPSLLNSATATVILDLPGSSLPSGTTPKKFVLYQLLDGPQGVVVADCGTTPNASPDTCIVSRAKYGTQGVELVLRVLGSLVDPRYVG
jgi:hypothetical protein